MVLDNSNLNGNSDARPPIDRAVEIERLAALEAIDYEVARKDAADRIGIRASTLDREVAKKRRALGLDKSDDDAGQGRAVTIQDVLPWADAIEGDRVATGLAAALKRYVVLSDTAADAVALWVPVATSAKIAFQTATTLQPRWHGDFRCISKRYRGIL